MPSKAELEFAKFWQQYQELFPMVAEHTFCPGRRFRIDFANLDHKLAVEIQGSGYGHSMSPKTLKNTSEKCQQLALMGWTYFPILASDCTKRIDIAVEPVLDWINTYTPVKLERKGAW